MRLLHLRIVLLIAVSSAPAIAQNREADTLRSPKTAKKSQPKFEKFELKDGDRVVFLGNTLFERAQKYGYWETMLTARYPNRKIIFRNLGWDGDTVWAESRGIFDTPAKGYQRMLAHVARLKPTVLFLGYGNNEAFAGKAGLPRFVKQYNKLLDDLSRVSAKGVRFVLLSPTFHEDLREFSHAKALFDQPARKNLESELKNRRVIKWNARDSYRKSLLLQNNQRIHKYCSAIRDVAKIRSLTYVDFHSTFIRPQLQKQYRGPYTSNGIHLSQSGYERSAVILERELFGSRISPDVEISLNARGELSMSTGSMVNRMRRAGSRIEFSVTSNVVPFAKWRGERIPSTNSLQVKGLDSGNYVLKVAGRRILSATAKEWSDARWTDESPDFKQAEKLRQAIIAKNRLFFYSWRPQNVTYLFLFRKHEQGQNAKEVKEFLKLVAAKEKEIDRLKKPITRTYELIRVKDGKKK